MTPKEYNDKGVIPAVLRMFRMADTPSARAALEKFAAAERAAMVAKGQIPATTITTTADLIEALRAADPTGALPVFLLPYEQPGADGSFLYGVPAPVRGFARHFIDTPEPCLPDAEGAFPCIWLEA